MSIFGLACPEILSDVVVVVIVDGLLLKLLLADGGPPKLKPPFGRPLSLRGIANDPPPVAGDDAADDALLPKPKDEKICNPGDPAPLLLLPNIPPPAAGEAGAFVAPPKLKPFINTKDVLCVCVR